MNKIKKIIKGKNLIITSVVFLLLIAIVGLKLSFSNPNNNYLRNQTIEGLSFENADIKYEDNVTIFTVEVYNENNEEFKLKDISINLTDKNNDTTTLTGYVGEKLDSKEGKLIIASIDKDLTSSNKLEYIINK